ncbi:hypothetical protein [Ruminococcus albus]|uniref:Uncharacterized protein n=1 Tax=Ruminococcus albus TaxID=1264 RepID=A0A1H7L6W5_RUMAL|nr:hypothetical protein [Ruminococcus albus]SEK94749.1 hypothetical protein SAMN05216469_10883 [Ruminococcus albus]
MKVNYYGIHSCEYILNEDKTLIAAPLGVKIQAVQQLGFYKAEDGRWYKELSPDEALFFHSMRNMDVVDFPADSSSNKQASSCAKEMSSEDKKKGFILRLIALLLVFGVGFASLLLFEKKSLPIAGSSFIVGEILMIYVNIRYPKKRSSKEVGVLLILDVVICITIVLILISCCNECTSCFKGC